MFNGKNLDGWKPKLTHHEYGENYKNTFRVSNGVIQVNYDGYDDFNNQFGHLFYEQPFSSYHLKLEYRFTNQNAANAPDWTKNNSGVMFHCQDPKTMGVDQDFPISIEFQLLAEDAQGNPRPTANMCSPGTEVYFGEKMEPEHCVYSDSKAYKANEWVHVELIVYQDSIVKHIVEGETVQTYHDLKIGGGVVSNFDPAVKKDGTALKSGYISLQSEGQGCEFRNIQIKQLH